MLIVAGGTHAGSKLKSTEVSIFSHSLGRLRCAITFDCDNHLVRFPNPLAGSWGTWLLSPSSPLPQLIKGTELLWWREGLLEVRQLFRSKAWAYETFPRILTKNNQLPGQWVSCLCKGAASTEQLWVIIVNMKITRIRKQIASFWRRYAQ